MIEKVTIQAIDLDRIEKDDAFPKAYAFYIILSGTPHPIWVELFMSRYESGFYNLKREMTIQGKEIRVLTAPGEEVNHVEFFRRLVDETNRDVDEHNAESAEAEKRQRRLEDQEAVEAEEIRQRLRKIQVGRG
jgi:hypothetical protein